MVEMHFLAHLACDPSAPPTARQGEEVPDSLLLFPRLIKMFWLLLIFNMKAFGHFESIPVPPTGDHLPGEERLHRPRGSSRACG